ncbi:cation diffusion facilitator family transporter [uncultured Marinobacter sp.]|uniref:cation diffusion facilitator family transporter n=1 Tax=uncultured Marinobacter sp. TaxID=187379 RepID=UPI0030D7B525
MSKSCSDQCSCDEPDTEATTESDVPTSSAEWLSVYKVPKMDCPSEERMIRLALGGFDSVQALSFDLSARTLEVFHNGDAGAITSKLETLRLGAVLQDTRHPGLHALEKADSDTNEAAESATLWILLAINGLMFLVEMTMGVIAQSAALIADSIDMFADAAVYGLALFAVGHGIQKQVRAAHIAGILQLILALGVLVEVGRRFLMGSEPQSTLMMIIAVVALIANTACLLLIAKHRKGGAHMKASWIFSANDVVINVGVILGGALVAWTGSNYPDLVIGAIVGVIVLSGARRILALKG